MMGDSSGDKMSLDANGRVRCIAFTKGKCVYGSACKNTHEEQRGDIGGDGRVDGNTCFSFQKGECLKGSSCKFSHTVAAGGGGE